MEKRLNVRVYGIWILDNKVLINEELIQGKKIIKFPGGGLEWGESTIDCLKREWQEELGIDIAILDHFYTTDFFQQSAFDNSQVISIYYLITASNPGTIVNHMENERTFWMDMKDITEETFTLPIDRKVSDLLYKMSNKKRYN